MLETRLHRYVPDSERSFNSAGCKLLREERVQGAIVTFEGNLRTQPNSSWCLPTLAQNSFFKLSELAVRWYLK